jgi:oligoendopeptidase F
VRLPAPVFDAADKAADSKLGDLPEWNLDDLYTGMDAPELLDDLARADADASAFADRFKGKLDELAAGDGPGLLDAVKAYEALDDLMGRIGSFAGLVYAGDTTDPKRAKFYGDVSEKLTNASSHLLFFALELNAIEDEVLDRALNTPGLDRYRPFFDDVRKERRPDFALGAHAEPDAGAGGGRAQGGVGGSGEDVHG